MLTHTHNMRNFRWMKAHNEGIKKTLLLPTLLPSKSSQARSTAVCSPSGDQTTTEPDRRRSPPADQCHPRWTGKPEKHPQQQVDVRALAAVWT